MVRVLIKVAIRLLRVILADDDKGNNDDGQDNDIFPFM